jgi:Cysteine-rich secretory protein family
MSKHFELKTRMPAILPETPVVETQIVEMTNAFRAENALGLVRSNSKLAAAARSYASYLARTEKFSHTADGREAGARVSAAGYQWCRVGENLALHADSRGFRARDLAAKSVEGWINSAPHRENLMAPHVTEIGVGVARAPGKDPRFISVQLFARPKALEATFQISNLSGNSVRYSVDGESHEVKSSFSVRHTSCSSGALSLDGWGSGARAKALTMRYEATDGLVYVLRPDKILGLRVEIKPLEKVR